jgi:hypothetical protein
MATTTIVQYLETAGVTGLGVSAPLGASTMDRSQTETFLSGAAITSGDWVMFDTTQSGVNKVLTVVQATNGATGQPLTVGVALNAATASGQKVKVCIAGYCATANVANAVAAAGVSLSINTTAGRGTAYVAADTAPICGVSLAAAAANVAPVWVIKQF